MWSSNSKNVLPFMYQTWSATFIGFSVALPAAGAPASRPSARRRRTQVVNRRIDDVAIDVELALDDVAKVDGGGESRSAAECPSPARSRRNAVR
jgi:hypothetical protein